MARRLKVLSAHLAARPPPPSASSLVAGGGAAAPPPPPVLGRPEPGKAYASWEKVAGDAGWQVFDGKLFLLGGWFDSFASPPRDVWSSEDGREWDLVTDLAGWKHSDFPMSCVWRGRIWMMGGWYNGRLPDCEAGNEVWSSADGKDWDCHGKAGWSARMAAGIVVFEDRLWILGGTENYYFGDEHSLKNDVWSTSDGTTWERATSCAPWKPRGYLRAVVHNNHIFVMGGGSYVFGGDAPGEPNGYRAFNDVWSSVDGIHWNEVISSAPWHPRIWFSAATFRDRIWLVGGWSSTGLAGSSDEAIAPKEYASRSTNFSQETGRGNWNWNDVWYSEDGREWFSWTPAACGESEWKERHAHSLLVKDDALYVFGGHVQPLGADVWRLQVSQEFFAET